jgi:hypothetical protein
MKGTEMKYAIILAHNPWDEVERLRKLAAELGWAVGHVVTEDVIRRSPRRLESQVMRRDRPEFRHILDMLYHGLADGLIASDLDVIAHHVLDLEDLIDVIEDKKVSAQVATVTDGIILKHDESVLTERLHVIESMGEYRGFTISNYGYMPVRVPRIRDARDRIIGLVADQALTVAEVRPAIARLDEELTGITYRHREARVSRGRKRPFPRA